MTRHLNPTVNAVQIEPTARAMSCPQCGHDCVRAVFISYSTFDLSKMSCVQVKRRVMDNLVGARCEKCDTAFGSSSRAVRELKEAFEYSMEE